VIGDIAIWLALIAVVGVVLFIFISLVREFRHESHKDKRRRPYDWDE